MQFYQSLIYAHRPWMSKAHSQLQQAKGPGADQARKVCMDSACAIARLLRLYEERWTLRRINIQAVAITFSAALLLSLTIGLVLEATGGGEYTPASFRIAWTVQYALWALTLTGIFLAHRKAHRAPVPGAVPPRYRPADDPSLT